MTELGDINVALGVVAEFNHREQRYIQHLTSRHYRCGLGFFESHDPNIREKMKYRMK